MKRAVLAFGLLAMTGTAHAQGMPGDANGHAAPKPVEISADQSLEWYQDQNLYVARGHAKAVRGDMTVEADVLTAHEREKPKAGTAAPEPAKTQSSSNGGMGDIDRMTAEGHVVISDPKQRVTGQKAVYDFDRHVIIVTGDNLEYQTDKQTVTAKNSLEYWEDRQIAVARGDAVAVDGDRKVKADVLTAEFRNQPNGTQEMTKMTATGHVTVFTKGDVSRGDQAVYDLASGVAVLTGHVRITRTDGTQLSGAVGEVNFKTNRSRLMNEGHGGRVRALLTPKTTSKATETTSSSSP